MNYLGYHRDCGGRIRQVFLKFHISSQCGRCNLHPIKSIDILKVNPMPKIIHQKVSGVKIKRKYYDMENK